MNVAATLSDLYSSTCLTWEALPGVKKISSQHSYPVQWGTQPSTTTTTTTKMGVTYMNI